MSAIDLQSLGLTAVPFVLTKPLNAVLVVVAAVAAAAVEAMVAVEATMLLVAVGVATVGAAEDTVRPCP